MPRSPDSLERIRDGRRTAILGAAERIFEADGFAAAKMSDIAREAGLSHGLVYHYFPSKDALIVELVEDRVDDKRARLATTPRTEDPVADLAVLVRVFIDELCESPKIAVTVMHALAQRSLPAAAEATIAGFARESFDIVRDRVRAGQAAGAVSRAASAEELTTAILALLRGYALLRSVPLGLPYEAPSADTVLSLLGVPRQRTADGPRPAPAVRRKARSA